MGMELLKALSTRNVNYSGNPLEKVAGQAACCFSAKIADYVVFFAGNPCEPDALGMFTFLLVFEGFLLTVFVFFFSEPPGIISHCAV